MGRKISSIVTLPEIKNWFKGEFWDSSTIEGDTFYAHSSNIEASVSPKSILFFVSISSEEDSSDSDEIVTEDPISFISDFLSTGTAGDEFFNRHSSVREIISSLYKSSSKEEMLIASKKLRRSVASLEFKYNQDIILSAIRSVVGTEVDNFDKIKEKIKKMGWKVRDEIGGPNGHPAIAIDISGIYEAKIEIDSILWEYSFILKGEESTRENGFSNDPIDAYKKWLKSPNIKEAIRNRIERIQNTKTSSP